MDEYPVINKILPEKSHFMRHQARGYYCLSRFKTCNLDKLKDSWATNIINNIKPIPILIFNIKDKLVWKFINDGECSVKRPRGLIMIPLNLT